MWWLLTIFKYIFKNNLLLIIKNKFKFYKNKIEGNKLSLQMLGVKAKTKKRTI